MSQQSQDPSKIAWILGIEGNALEDTKSVEIEESIIWQGPNSDERSDYCRRPTLKSMSVVGQLVRLLPRKLYLECSRQKLHRTAHDNPIRRFESFNK